MAKMMAIGSCVHRTTAVRTVLDQARAAEAAGYDELWVIEDCFFTAGVSLAAAALTATERIDVGIGIAPAVVRNPVFTAMEFATLSDLGPGRFHGGIGHGVSSWMARIGALPDSPLSALDESVTVVRRLLAGETVTFHGRYVDLDDARLESAPAVVPPVSLGVRGPRSLELSGRVGDGTVLVEFSGPTYVRWARERIAAGRSGDVSGDGQAGDGEPSEAVGGSHRVTVFAAAAVSADGDAARHSLSFLLAEVCADAPPSLRMAPFFDELEARAQRDGWLAAVQEMPAEWWGEIAAVGTADEVQHYLQQMADAGVDSLVLFPDPKNPVGDAIQLASQLGLAP